MKIIDDNRERFDQLVAALLERETISRKEFVALMETGEIPEGIEDEDKPQPEEPMKMEPAEEAPAAPCEEKPEIPEEAMTIENLTDEN